MSLSIPITGLSANDPIPGEYIEINFAQGPASSGTTSYDVLLMGNKLSTGSAVDHLVYGPDTETAMTSEAEAIALFGAGSELHRMVRAFFKSNNVSKLYAIPVKESTGSQAEGEIKVTGTATFNGTIRVLVCDEFVEVPVISGDDEDSIASAISVAINSQKHFPVIASVDENVVTVTAKQKGLRGNLIKVSAKMISSGTVTTVVTPSAHTALSGGTTADSNVDALAAILPDRYYYIVSSAIDATQLGALKAQIDNQAAPLVGIRQRMVAGSVDTLANAITVATGLNAARAEIVWQAGGDLLPGELASMACAGYAFFEASSVPRLNFNSFGDTDQDASRWFAKKPLSANGPTRSQILSALNNGLTPVSASKTGKSFIVKRVTTRSQASGTPDYRVRDAHIVTVCDLYADDLKSKLHLQFSGVQIGDDPAPGQVPAVKVATPMIIKAAVNQLTRDYASRGLLENDDKTVSETIVVREKSPTTRMCIKVPLDVIDILNQIGAVIDQIG